MAVRQGIKTIASSLLYSAKNGEPYGLTFYYDEKEPLTKTQKERLQAELKKSFELWSNTWIIPRIEAILAKFEEQ